MLPSKAELNELLDYDPKTGELRWKPRPPTMFKDTRSYKTWNKRYAGQRAFTALTAKGYHTGAIHNKLYRACRVIIKMTSGVEPDEVDHEDGDRANDRLLNLRDVTNLVNHKNMKTPSNNTSGHIGVHWVKAKQRWKVSLGRKHIGYREHYQDAIDLRKQVEEDNDYHPNHGR